MLAKLPQIIFALLVMGAVLGIAALLLVVLHQDWEDALLWILAAIMLISGLLVVTMRDIIRCGLAMIVCFMALAGIYGTVSYAVAQRTNEIGVRMALGATSNDILIAFGRRGMVLTLAGLAIGLVLAAAAARSLTALLYGFRPDYLPAALTVSLILLAVAALACSVPSLRASRIDPMIALRNE